MKKEIIVVKDIVTGTSTNTEGMSLFLAMDKALANGSIIVLSLKACTPMASSFLNSSIGSLVEKHGFDFIKGRFLLADHTPAMVTLIRDYINGVKNLAHK